MLPPSDATSTSCGLGKGLGSPLEPCLVALRSGFHTASQNDPAWLGMAWPAPSQRGGLPFGAVPGCSGKQFLQLEVAPKAASQNGFALRMPEGWWAGRGPFLLLPPSQLSIWGICTPCSPQVGHCIRVQGKSLWPWDQWEI